MNELSRYVFETIANDGEFIISRGVAKDAGAPLLLITPSLQQPDPASLQRLEHAFALRSDLDRAWTALPLALVHHDEKLVLVAEDPGGEPLAYASGKPVDVAQFLRISIGLAKALGFLHARGLIHKNVKPASFLVNAASGDAWLTGFGIASRLPRDHQTPEPAEVIAGTLAYMAPEQTGRMNRSIDSRSDLYSLGITFYEMLAGELPFAANDPMEWIHCHVARRPAPLFEKSQTVPRQLSDIVMKLLAKTVEERYQTAAGLQADLQRCRRRGVP
ncbi:MAG: serine/threonine protein kinase, partial [bacterium]|nr:serine/threonine protein kinase [Candidatus Kapabacteria bacterium]